MPKKTATSSLTDSAKKSVTFSNKKEFPPFLELDSLRFSDTSLITKTNEHITPPYHNNHPSSFHTNRSFRKSEATLASIRQTSRLQNVNEIILKANLPPDYTEESNIDSMFAESQARKYYKQQFLWIQNHQTQTSPYTLRFDKKYEPGFAEYTQLKSVLHIRFTFVLAILALLGLFVYEITKSSFKKEPHQTLLYVLSFGVAIPVLLLGIAMTFLTYKHLEKVFIFVIGVVAIVLIIKKPLSVDPSGPILPLVILVIPIFAITRIRFIYASILAMSIFVSFVTINYIWMKKGAEKKTMYQSINFSISMIGGMIASYRQEILRRRNYALRLPFGRHVDDNQDSQSIAKTCVDRYNQDTLLHRYSCKFIDPQVEEMFYRFWYLIDPFPYEDTSSKEVHTGTFRLFKGALMGLVLTFVLMGVQDYRNLPPKQESLALVLRFGVIIPGYIGVGVFVYLAGRKYYEHSLGQTEKIEKAIANRYSVVHNLSNKRATHGDYNQLNSPGVVMDLNGDITKMTQSQKYSIWTNPEDRMTRPDDKYIFVPKPPQTEDFKWKVAGINVIPKEKKGGYVRSTQFLTSIVVVIHLCCMGGLLIYLTNIGKAIKVYYMGYINGILFAHRSGFRLRFIYATHSSVIAASVFMIGAIVFKAKAVEYIVYTVIVVLLGMCISREEELVRRNFFILRAIRTLEFDEWFTAVLRVQAWMKRMATLKREARRRRRRRKGLPVEEDPIVITCPPSPIQNGSRANAGKYGAYMKMTSICIAAIEAVV